MIKFKVEYLKEHNAIGISATINDQSANCAVEYTDDPEKFAQTLNTILETLINGKRAKLVDGKFLWDEPLSKGI